MVLSSIPLLASWVGVSGIGGAGQVHLTTTGVPTEMVVSWSEQGPPPALWSRVLFGRSPDALGSSASAAPAVMTTNTEDMATYSYCGGTFEVHHLRGQVTLDGWLTFGVAAQHAVLIGSPTEVKCHPPCLCPPTT